METKQVKKSDRQVNRHASQKESSRIPRWFGIRQLMVCLCFCLGMPHLLMAQETEVYTIYASQAEGKLKVILDYNNMINAAGFEITPPAGVVISQNAGYSLAIQNGKAVGKLADHVKTDGAGQIIFDISREGGLPLNTGEYPFSIVMISDDECRSDAVNFKVDVKALPVLHLMTDAEYCNNDEFNVTGTIDAMNNVTLKYKWKTEIQGTPEEISKVSPGDIASVDEIAYTDAVKIAGQIINENAKPIVVKYTVTPVAYYTNNGNYRVEGKPVSVNVTVNPKLDLTLPTDPIVLCNGSTTQIVLNSNLAAGTGISNQVEWSRSLISGSMGSLDANGSGKKDFPATIAESLTTDGNSDAVVRYTVTQTYTTANKTCTIASVIDVTVHPTPTLEVIEDQTICSGTAATVNLATTIDPSVTVKYKIEVTGGENVEGESGTTTDVDGGNWTTGVLTLSENIHTPQTLLYTVTPKIGDCTGTPVTFSIIVNPAPTVTADQVKDTVCTGNSAAIVLNTDVEGADVTYTITCEANSNIGGLPVAATTVVAANGSEQTWTTPALTNATGSLQTAKFTITPSIGGKCPGTALVYEVTVVPAVTLAAIDAPSPVCSEDGVGTISFTSPALDASVTDHVVYHWNFEFDPDALNVVGNNVNIKDNGTTQIASGTGAFSITKITNKSDAQSAIQVKVQAKYNGMDCAVSQERTFEVKVNPKPKFKLGKN